MQAFRPYQAKNGEVHRACAKAECHRVFDQTKGDFSAKCAAVVALAKKIGTIKETTARQWSYNWNNPRYLERRKERAGRAHSISRSEVQSQEFSEDVAPFRRQDDMLERRKSISISLSENIIGEAAAMNLNVSQIAEDAIRRRIKDERGRRWAEENREFIDTYNAYIERNGVFGEELLDLDDPPV